MRAINVPLPEGAAEQLQTLAQLEHRDAKAQATALLVAGLEAAGLPVPEPGEAIRGIGWDDDRVSHVDGARVIVDLPRGLARRLASAATREYRTVRQQAVHELSRALGGVEAEP